MSFVIDLKYAGLFGVRNVPDDQLQPFFLAEAPRILFPFARRVVADAVQDGGFPPLLLEPIDFHGLFAQQVQAAQAETAGDVTVGQACFYVVIAGAEGPWQSRACVSRSGLLRYARHHRHSRPNTPIPPPPHLPLPTP